MAEYKLMTFYYKEEVFALLSPRSQLYIYTYTYTYTLLPHPPNIVITMDSIAIWCVKKQKSTE